MPEHPRPRWLLRVLSAAAGLIAINLMIAAVAQAAAPIGQYSRTGAYRYITAPKLAPPKIKAAKSTKTSLGAGYFLIANFKNLSENKPLTGQGGPVMYDSHLQPVWVHGVSDNVFSLNFATQTYAGQPALSWWEGVVSPTGAVSNGRVVVVDQHYKTIGTVTGQDGWTISMHENTVRGTDMWVTSYKPVPMDLSAYGGSKNGILLDSAVQEYDIKTGKLLYTWDAAASGHIPLSESQTKPVPASAPTASTTPWDAYHINALQLLSNGQFLTSMRNTWAAYDVNQASGNILWRLGGKNSSYTIPSNAQFQWQHDVRLHSDGTVSMFDNGCCGFGATGFLPPNGPTRGLLLRLDTSAHAVTLISSYSLSGVAVGSQGNTELLPSGNVLVGFGQQPYFAGFTKGGKLLFEAVMPSPDESYRAYLQRWTGKPLYGPSAAARKRGSNTTVYASWNGATSVVSWRVLAGKDKGHLKPVATRRRSGFETAIGLKGSFGSFKVQALDSKGHVLRTTGAFSVSKTQAHHAPPGGFY